MRVVCLLVGWVRGLVCYFGGFQTVVVGLRFYIFFKGGFSRDYVMLGKRNNIFGFEEFYVFSFFGKSIIEKVLKSYMGLKF